MKLAPRIIVRNEVDGRLLYNGDNGGLVQLSHDAYRRWVVEDRDSEDGYQQAHAWLIANGFLVESSKSEGSKLQAARESGDGFYDLRSARSPFNVLWALTSRCNLRCVYCFPDVASKGANSDDPALDAVLGVADQLVEAKVLKVTLTGGECLLYRGVWKVVERLRGAGMTVALISNGAAITSRVAAKLAVMDVRVGISLDAPDERTTAKTRGPGAFRRAFQALRTLLENDVPVSALVTLTRHNFDGLGEHIDWLRSLGVRFITLQDLRPFGTPQQYDRTRLTVEQEQRLVETFAKIRTRHPALVIEPSELFICAKTNSSGKVMQCPAGDNFAYIDFNGNVFPCTSLPSFCLGNVLAGASLVDLWTDSTAIARLRAIKQMRVEELPGCADCTNRAHCEGGCRGDALFYQGDLFGRPSRCPRELGMLP